MKRQEVFVSRFVRDHVDVMAKVNWNKISFRDGWSYSTAKATLDVCFWLWDNGYAFAVEVKMKNGLRADIVVPELVCSQVIEIMDSESVESFNKKKVLYDSSGVSVLGVPADGARAIHAIRAANNV